METPIPQWRKARELHLRTSYESFLSQFALVHKHPNTAAVCTTATALTILVGDGPRTERKNSTKEIRKAHDLEVSELQQLIPLLLVLIPGFY